MTYIFMIMSMVIGTTITLSSSSWIIIWMGMEMNLLGFIPLINFKKMVASTEAAMKYFIIQAISSSLFIVSSFFSLNNSFSLTLMSSSLMMSALLLKIGSAPFHFWLFPLVKFLSWNTLLLLLTWQKVAPLFIMYFLQSNLLPAVIPLNAIIGSMLLLNQTSMKTLLTYSSIAHLGWMMFSLMCSSFTFSFYLLIYFLSMIILTSMLNKLNISYFAQIFNLPSRVKNLIMINFLSLMGFPPLMGFFPKLLALLHFSLPDNNMTSLILSLILIYSAFLSMFSYMRTFAYCFSSKSMNMIPNNYHYLSLISFWAVLPLMFSPILLMTLI